MRYVIIVLRHLFPRKIQHCLQIHAEHVGLLASARHGLEPFDLSVNLVLRLLVRL